MAAVQARFERVFTSGTSRQSPKTLRAGATVSGGCLRRLVGSLRNRPDRSDGPDEGVSLSAPGSSPTTDNDVRDGHQCDRTVPRRTSLGGERMNRGLKSAFERGDDPLGTWLSIGHPVVAEVSALGGFDFLLLDTEHTSMSLETVENMVRAVEATEGRTEMVVRVPANDPVRIKRVLDIGAPGIMVPMIESAADARAFVEATRYPPDGVRGIATGRATAYGREFLSYVAEANDRLLRIVQIENRAGLSNAEEIAAVDGVDALFVGPADLSGALGVFAEWDADDLTAAMERVVDAGRTAGVPVGTLTVDPDDIEMRLDQGFDFLVVGKDTASLLGTHEQLRARYDAVRSAGSEADDGP
jgi:2-dehydro-3-deoxyglucarate aldolase/4-hydroxy-2-oxoheptanedioate aldolase